MHTKPNNNARSCPRRRGPLAATTAMLALLLAPALVAQTFVAEWSEADIGRVGPTGLAIDSVGGSSFLYVADQPSGRILKIDLATGTRVAAWGEVGNGPLQFNSPFGVAVDPISHDLYIAERGNNRVQRITNTGTFVMGWGETGTAPGQFESPIGIAADAQGNVYVVDHDNDRVEKFHVQAAGSGWDVQLVTTWGGRGSANGQFDGPYGLTLDAKGNVWVADGRNHRLQKFDANGNFLAAVGTYGTGDGQFVTPVWVNFDATGAYYVAETNTDPQDLSAPDLQNQRIQKFSADGKFQLKWGAYGEAGGQFKLPFDVVVDGAGNAYVADYYNTRLQKFSLTTPPPPPPPGGGTGSGTQFVNVSSRLRANAQRPLIAGFVVSGTASKQMLIRAVGPALTQYGVTGALPNPKLQVYSGTKLLAENDDWGGDAAVSAAADRVQAFPLPATSRDAALLITLPPGVYSAQVADNGGDGVALVEVYDADSSTTTKVINLSTRGVVDTGDGVLVAGFVVKGTAPKRVLIRGVGPALATFGVTDALANPVLKVFTPGNVLVAQNDDWETTQTVAGGPAPGTTADISAAVSATGAFGLPAGGKDAAMVVTLQPGSYSAIVSGANATTGTALVEVYEVPTP
jgi:sugar lactone lactonase YvrE